ncbi:MAG: hypothetical protein C4539_17665 [Ignavibacteriales bacterium]|nr:MAG: hypothetical protein C4539_17665 [Ignavibacteriales bacterium]
MNSERFFVLLFICTLTHIVRTAYEILKHKEILKPNKLSFAIIFSNMILLWITWFTLCSYDIYKIDLPVILKYFGLLIVILGVIIFVTALFTIKSLETYKGDLITKGIYSKVRHPMYLGFIFLCIGSPIFFGAVISVITSLFFTFNILF